MRPLPVAALVVATITFLTFLDIPSLPLVLCIRPQALVSYALQDDGSVIQLLVAGAHQFVFIVSGPLCFVLVACTGVWTGMLAFPCESRGSKNAVCDGSENTCARLDTPCV